MSQLLFCLWQLVDHICLRASQNCDMLEVSQKEQWMKSSAQCLNIVKLLCKPIGSFAASSCLWVSKQIICFPFRKTRDDLNCYQEQCDAILKDVSAALEHLDSLQKQYLFVSNKTGTLHEACEQLLKEQVRLRAVISIDQPRPHDQWIAKTWSVENV